MVCDVQGRWQLAVAVACKDVLLAFLGGIPKRNKVMATDGSRLWSYGRVIAARYQLGGTTSVVRLLQTEAERSRHVDMLRGLLKLAADYGFEEPPEMGMEGETR